MSGSGRADWETNTKGARQRGGHTHTHTHTCSVGVGLTQGFEDQCMKPLFHLSSLPYDLSAASFIWSLPPVALLMPCDHPM